MTFGNASSAAVVCYAADRNELRGRVIQWLQTEVVPDGWFAKGSNFSEILLKYFKVGIFVHITDLTLFVQASLIPSHNICLAPTSQIAIAESDWI